ncbi:RHS repeat-associated core domain-containing protein [Enterobacter ludwigii]|uniref:RHS repeat-associated core domain-containing protein n=1 Tax=Enterobacter ludwigii TaxID=299767 RepID=UPI003D2026E3
MNNDFTTQSGNFVSALQTHVDPRTGQFMARLPLADLTGNNLLGPDLSLSLGYSPLSTNNIGFGTGFSLGLTRFNNRTNLLELSNGEQYRVMPGTDTVRNKKLDNFRFTYTNGFNDGDGYTVYWKEGKQELLTIREDYTTFETTKIVSPLGRILSLSWDWSGQYARLYRIADETSILCQITYGSFTTMTVWPGTADEYQTVFELIDSDSRLNVVRRQISASETLYWYFHYDLVGPGMGSFHLSGIDYPTGMKDRVIYNQVDGLHFPYESGLNWLPVVISHTRTPGGGQPEMVVQYEYTAHNFLGYNGNFGNWSWDNDYLYTTLTDYRYGSTETRFNGSDSVVITRTYNNYHLQVSEESRRQNSTVRTDFIYYAQEWVFIDAQPPQFQLPREQKTTWTDSAGNNRSETTLTEFDISGNPVRSLSPDGTETLITWYAATGEDGAPAEPNGFVRLIKEQTVIPPQTGFDAPVRRTRYRYTTLSEPGHIVQESVEESADGRPLYYRRNDYSRTPGQPEYGRLTRITDKKYEDTAAFTSRQDFTTTVSGGVMSQTATFTGHDGITATTTRQQSVYSGLLLRETSPQDVVVTYEYDRLGRLLARTSAPGTPYESILTWSYAVTSDGPETTETDASGNQLKTRFDGAGRQTGVQQLDKDATGKWFEVSSSHYNTLGEVDTGTGNDWLTPEASQFHVGMNASRDGWGGVRDIAFTDGIRNNQDASPVTLSRTVYATGNTASGTLFSGRGITLFDSRSQLPVTDSRVKVSGTALADRHYKWDGAGRMREETDERGNVTRRTWDAYNRVVTQTLPDGSVVTRTYAPHLTGDAVAAISVSGPDADGNRQTWLMGTQEFDGLGRLTKRLSGGRLTRFTYQGASPVPSVVTLPSGKTLQYTYIPALGNVVSSMTAEGISQVFTYDPKTADLLNAREGGTENTNVWNPSGTLKNETFSPGGVSRTAEHSYTLNGEPVLYRDITGKALRYDRDDFGRIITITDDALSAKLKYDALGRMISQAVTDTASSSGLTTALEYDDFGREITRTITDSTGVTLSLSQTWLDNDLLATRTTRQSGAVIREEKYDYDNRNRLVSYAATGSSLVPDAYGHPMTGQVYRYDALNNLTTVTTTLGDGTSDTATYHYENGEDPTQLTRVTHTHAGYPQTITLAYDANGHMTRDEAGRTLEYDASGRLSGVSGEGISGGGYGYDALNRLVSQNVSNADTRRLYYRNDERVNEVLTQQSRDVRLVKAGSSCLGVSNGASLTLTGSDHHDSLLWSREVSGAEGRQHAWAPYGTGEPVDLLPGFNGERADPVSGSYHLGNGYRAYNPVLMRFNCPDSLSPFGAGGINPYAYCAGDPVNFTDPSGHLSWQAITGIVVGAIGIALAAFTAGASIVAAGGVMAAISAASTTSLVFGGLSVVADVTAIASGATEDVNPAASSVLGWVSLGTGIAGVGAIAGPAAKAGRSLSRRSATSPVEARNSALTNANINLHPQNAAPTGYYKALSIDVSPSGGYKVESWLSHNLTADNESWLVIHGDRDGLLGYSDPIAKYRKNKIILTNSYMPEEFAGHLLRKGIDIWELASTSQLHVVACFSGGEGRAVQRLANYVNSPVFGYGNNEYLRNATGSMFKNIVYDDFHNVLEADLYLPKRTGTGIPITGRRREIVSQV